MARKKVGPKVKFEINEGFLLEIETLAGRGLTQEEIHHYYCVSSSTWYGYVRKYPELSERVKRGKAKTKSFVGGKLMELIKAGNVAATIFYMKCNGMSEKSSLEILNDKEEAPPTKIVLVKDPQEAAKIYERRMKGKK